MCLKAGRKGILIQIFYAIKELINIASQMFVSLLTKKRRIGYNWFKIPHLHEKKTRRHFTSLDTG